MGYSCFTWWRLSGASLDRPSEAATDRREEAEEALPSIGIGTISSDAGDEDSVGEGTRGAALVQLPMRLETRTEDDDMAMPFESCTVTVIVEEREERGGRRKESGPEKAWTATVSSTATTTEYPGWRIDLLSWSRAMMGCQCVCAHSERNLTNCFRQHRRISSGGEIPLRRQE